VSFNYHHKQGWATVALISEPNNFRELINGTANIENQFLYQQCAEPKRPASTQRPKLWNPNNHYMTATKEVQFKKSLKYLEDS